MIFVSIIAVLMHSKLTVEALCWGLMAFSWGGCEGLLFPGFWWTESVFISALAPTRACQKRARIPPRSSLCSSVVACRLFPPESFSWKGSLSVLRKPETFKALQAWRRAMISGARSSRQNDSFKMPKNQTHFPHELKIKMPQSQTQRCPPLTPLSLSK